MILPITDIGNNRYRDEKGLLIRVELQATQLNAKVAAEERRQHFLELGTKCTVRIYPRVVNVDGMTLPVWAVVVRGAWDRTPTKTDTK